MMKKPALKLIALAITLLAGGLVGVFTLSGNGIAQAGDDVITMPPPAKIQFETDEISIRKDTGEELFFNVELAKTGPQKSQGLMFRTEMAENAGMLFLFGRESKISFWMKNTLIPLDMLFLSADGTIHHIHHNAKPQDETSITSKYDSIAVLELNGGTADIMGIEEGDMVIHPYFKNAGVAQ